MHTVHLEDLCTVGEPAASSPERELAIAVVLQAVEDLEDLRERGPALAWLRGPDALRWLDPLGLDQDAVLAAIEARPAPVLELTERQRAVLAAAAQLEARGAPVTGPRVSAIAGGTLGAAQQQIRALKTLGVMEAIDDRRWDLGARVTPAGLEALGSG